MLTHPQNLIICPVCDIVTGEVLAAGHGRRIDIRYHRAAADPPDGNRCQKHARSVGEFRDEIVAALRWAGVRS